MLKNMNPDERQNFLRMMQPQNPFMANQRRMPNFLPRTNPRGMQKGFGGEQMMSGMGGQLGMMQQRMMYPGQMGNNMMMMNNGMGNMMMRGTPNMMQGPFGNNNMQQMQM